MKTILVRLSAFILALVMMLSSACLAETVQLAEGADLRIMSFNILHPDWDDKVPVTDRLDIVVSVLTDYMPDVVALQEAGPKWHRALKPVLVDTGIFGTACRQSNKEGFTFCATTFLYNPQTVTLVEEYIEDLDLVDAARVVSIAVFERISDGSRFVVTNTHPAPTNQVENHERNMADLFRICSELQTKYPDLPIFMAGDYNLRETSERYALFQETVGVQNSKYLAEVLACDQPTYIGWQEGPDYDGACAVDHIFVNDKMVVKLYNMVLDHDVANASDHCPLYIDVTLK